MDFGGVVVGLGNPGNQYAGTRHNCGFAFVESLLDHVRREGGQVQSQNGGKFSCELWRLRYDGLPGDWLAAMPQTFMNLSGQCVQPLLAWHKIRPDQLVVVHDELDIPAGELRFKKGAATPGTTGSNPSPSCWGRRTSTVCVSVSGGLPRKGTSSTGCWGVLAVKMLTRYGQRLIRRLKYWKFLQKKDWKPLCGRPVPDREPACGRLFFMGFSLLSA